MITLSDMLADGVAIDWPEAVALVREIVALADQDGNLSLVPTLEAVGVRADGTVHAIGPTVAEGDPVVAAAGALGRLLGDQPCPPELRALVAQSLQGAAPKRDDREASPKREDREGGPSSLAEFDQALSYFERPGRKPLLRALYERADVVESEQIAEAELARLTARARGAERPPPPILRRIAPAPIPPVPAPPVARQRRSIPVPLVIGLAVVALAALVAAGVGLVGGSRAGWASGWWPSWGGDATTERPQLVPEGTGDEAAAEKGERRAARSGQPAVAPEASAGEPVAVRARIGRERPSDSVSIEIPMAGATGTGESAEQVVHIQTLPVPEGSNFVAPPDAAVRQAIYMTDDPSVTPPEILRPHLPSEPADWLTPGNIGTFDLLVRPDGGVEQVRLTSPSNRFQERMLLSAAKAWRFRPATRAGVPVWCHVRIRVTI